MPEKFNKDAAIIIGAGILLACSGLWKIYGMRNDSEPVAVIPGEPVVTESVTTSAYTASDVSGEEKLYIYETTEAASAAVTESVTEPLMVNINTAGHDELVMLYGIGDHLADEIISYREANGGFMNIEELMNVSGIGESVFAGLMGQVYVEDPVYENNAHAEDPYEQIFDVNENESDEPETEPEPTEHILTLEEAAPININTAGSELLTLLPYVDDETAERIICFREEIDGYQHPYELLLIEGLTQPQVAEIIRFVTVGD